MLTRGGRGGLKPYTGTLPTPRTISTLYRMVLRQAGAAVLYSKPASPNLRALYRPEFDVWMGRARRESDADKVDRRVEWEEFATRVQNTLDFLRRSSTHISTPDRVTGNLASLKYHMDPPVHVLSRAPSAVVQATLHKSRPEFAPGKKTVKESEWEKFYAWDAFGHVVHMAEAEQGLLLGRVRPREKLRR